MQNPSTIAGSTTQPLWMVKWGGGLITEKTEAETLLEDVLTRLCGELVRGLSRSKMPIVLGHGSGSFGHWAAKGSFLSTPQPRRGTLSHPHAKVVASTADAAARLHREVIGSLLEAGLCPFSWLPSSALFRSDSGVRVSFDVIAEALLRGMLPVVMGDVVLAQGHGAEIWSTERVFEAARAGLEELGFGVVRVLWLGNTNGILGADGQRIDRVQPDQSDLVAAQVGGSAGVDVTGGMRLRFETCRRLAERGVESWILDGREPLVLERALSGDRQGGTEIVACSGRSQS